MKALTDAQHQIAHELACQVDRAVENQHGWLDAGNLCYDLVSTGVIPLTATVSEAVTRVVQQLETNG